MKYLESNIGKLIEERGYKKKFVAEKMKISQTQLSNWINGSSFPKTPKLFELADFLQCSVDQLYTKKEE